MDHKIYKAIMLEEEHLDKLEHW